MRAINKLVRKIRNVKVALKFWPLKGKNRIVGYPDAAFRNNPDKSSQRGQTIFLAEPRQKGKVDGRGSLIDYESQKIKRMCQSTTVSELYAFMKCYGTCQFLKGLWMDMTGEAAEIHMRTDANNLVTTSRTTHLPEQKETIHMIQMLRKEACSGNIDDLAHIVTQHMLADCLTKDSAQPDNLIKAIETGVLVEVDKHPPFRELMKDKHKAYHTFVTWAINTLDGASDIVTILGEFVQPQIHEVLFGKR